MKVGDLVKYREDYNLKKRGLGIVMDTHEKESRVYFLEDELSKSVWVFTEWLKEARL
jgi:hypothetical protein